MTFLDTAHPRLLELAPNGQAKVDFLAWFNDAYVIDKNHMLVNPNNNLITHKLLPEAASQSKIDPHMVVLHTQASGGRASNENSYGWAIRGTNIEPHIFGPQMDDGKMMQTMPFNVRADCTGSANRFRQSGVYKGAIAFETQDNGNTSVNKTPWTWIQIGPLVGAVTALCFTYRILCGDCAWEFGSGIAPHNRWAGWSPGGHSCPGTARSAQMDGIRGAVATRLATIYEAVGESCPAA